MGKLPTSSSSSLADLPLDELVAYGRELGLLIDPTAPRGELLRLIRARQELLVELDRDALLDVVKWARIPVRRSASKEQLAKQMATITKARFDGLSNRGLRALARLRGTQVGEGEPRTTLERRLRRQEGLWARVTRKRRRVIGSLVSKFVDASPAQGDYQFLPEENGGSSLKESIEEVGVMSGIAHKLRGAADQYLREKLDEIERRIDRKLDEIDSRLGEWRDQEIRNRLRIVKITLITAIVVAIVSLGYDYLKARSELPGQTGPPVAGAVDTEPPG
ncbi:MAG: hypothetical protein JSU86_12455 [Phycisphaerales bacterium]|nr:MAG: hypothetical protein JSU86_12455 [Phycisphaerales bacterium]